MPRVLAVLAICPHIFCETNSRLVVDTLTPLEATRRAYRLVGGVLVERSVREVLPTVQANQEGIKQLLAQLATSQAEKERAATEWKVHHATDASSRA